MAVAALALAGCGDDDTGGGGRGGASGTGESAFCGGLTAVYQDLGAGQDVDITTDEGLAAIDDLQALDPPDEIADDFRTFVEFLETAATQGQATDPDLVAEWTAATERLDTYAIDECGMTPPGS